MVVEVVRVEWEGQEDGAMTLERGLRKVGSFYAAWTFSEQEAALFIQGRLLDSPTPLETLIGLATEGRDEAAFRQPALLVGTGCDSSGPLPADLMAIELYVLAISRFLTTAPGVRYYQQLALELRRAGADELEALRMVYGDEFDELPKRHGGRDFQELWDQIAGPPTTRTGWLGYPDLHAYRDVVGRLTSRISDAAAQQGLVDLDLVYGTAIARSHDLLVLAG
jgi:hypothetical protein